MLFEYLMLRARLFLDDTGAASAIEYAIVVAMVAVVVVVFITPIGGKVFAIFNNLIMALGGSSQTLPTQTP